MITAMIDNQRMSQTGRIQGRGNALHFGWAMKGHEAIHQVAVDALPDSSWKRYLNQQQKTLMTVSGDEDRKRMGPGHFVHCEETPQPPRHRSALERAWDKVTAHFLPVKTSLARRLPSAHFEPNTLLAAPGPNVYQSIFRHYDGVVKALTSLTKPLNSAENASLNESLQNNLGALSHYVGDMYQPMHTTAFYKWEIPNGTSDAHQFLETRVLTAAEHRQWQQSQRAVTTKLKAASETILKNEVASALNHTYGKVSELVTVDANARRRATDANQVLDRSHYRQLLVNGWKPIAKAQMSDSSLMLATLLASAYVQAGSPDLSAVFQDATLTSGGRKTIARTTKRSTGHKGQRPKDL